MSNENEENKSNKLYAVSYMNFWDNELVIQLIKGYNWKNALSKHTTFNNPKYPEDYDMEWISDDMEKAKEDLLNADMTFDIIEIK